jgi:hypothetical protein
MILLPQPNCERQARKVGGIIQEGHYDGWRYEVLSPYILQTMRTMDPHEFLKKVVPTGGDRMGAMNQLREVLGSPREFEKHIATK